jgi:RNA polymerase sigma-32 factor
MAKSKKGKARSKPKRRPAKAGGSPRHVAPPSAAAAKKRKVRPVARAVETPRVPVAEREPEVVEPEVVEPEVVEPEGVEPEVVQGPGVEPGGVETVSPASAARSLQRADPLRAYMAEVQRHPLLSREDETSLARTYRATGDLDAAARLVSANLRLVVKLAHEYHRNPLALLDLIQEGNIGLMQAVKKFDPERGVKLSTYAAWWIRAYILRYIMDNWKMVKIGTTEAQRKLFFKLRQEQQRLVSQGIDPSPKLLAERLHVTEQDVQEMDQRLGQDEVSLDAPVGEDGKTTRGERFLPSSAAPPADEQLANDQLKRLFREKLYDFAQELDGKEKYIFEKRLISEQPLTLQEIGAHFGVSRERARQIEAQLIGRMREHLRKVIPDFDVVARPER